MGYFSNLYDRKAITHRVKHQSVNVLFLIIILSYAVKRKVVMVRRLSRSPELCIVYKLLSRLSYSVRPPKYLIFHLPFACFLSLCQLSSLFKLLLTVWLKHFDCLRLNSIINVRFSPSLRRTTSIGILSVHLH